jgi:histidinol-phosphate/aromatic aminotransferase/cobyric acid decarboxylase-like protein
LHSFDGQIDACVLLKHHEPPLLIVLRSLGKFFGLAGACVGFVSASPTLLAKLRKHLGPWTLPGPSRWIAKKALSDTKRLNQLVGRTGNTPSAE